MRLHGKIALVTGGGSGIGAAIAQLFAKEGAMVVVSDIIGENAETVARTIPGDGGRAVSFNGDVTRSEDAQAMVQKAVETFGALHIVVNSAGISARNVPDGTPHEEVWDAVINTNLKGTYLVSWAAVPEIARSGGGAFVHLASIMSLVSYPSGVPGLGGPATAFNPYNPSKGGVLQLTKNMAVHLAKQNIRVNCLCPGFIVTPLTTSVTNNPESHRALIERHPIGRLGNPEEVASAALFLASDEASFITGTPLIVDGGYTAH